MVILNESEESAYLVIYADPSEVSSGWLFLINIFGAFVFGSVFFAHYPFVSYVSSDDKQIDQGMAIITGLFFLALSLGRMFFWVMGCLKSYKILLKSAQICQIVPNSETYERLQESRNIQRAEVVADASAAVTFVAPRYAPITALAGGIASGYLLYKDPSLKNAVGVGLSIGGKIPFKRMGWSERASQRGSAGLQLTNSRLDYDGKK